MLLFRSSIFAMLIVICTFLLINKTFACVYNDEQKRTSCSSLHDLIAAGERPEWSKLNVNNFGNESFVPIEKNTFVNVPNIRDLQVKGLANEIQAGAFNGLVKLYELHLDDNKLNTIPPKAFSHLPIQVLYVYFCDVQEIAPDALKNLPNLKWVYFYGNEFRTIEEGVFTGSNITHAILRRNGIREVKPNAFGNMEKLVHLSLEENEMTTFEPQFAIGFSATMTHLYINRNKLSKMTRDMFSIVPNLKVLLLNINSIQRFGDYVFNDLKQLALLDISNNRLEEIQSNVFNSAGMRYLQIIFLHNNQLTFLSTGVLARLPSLRRLSLGGNPWQCPCWNMVDSYLRNNNVTHLCYEIYTQGSRPFCVISDLHSKDCIYDLESVRDLPQLYIDTMREYPQLPPVCNVDGAEKPFLGA